MRDVYGGCVMSDVMEKLVPLAGILLVLLAGLDLALLGLNHIYRTSVPSLQIGKMGGDVPFHKSSPA